MTKTIEIRLPGLQGPAHPGGDPQPVDAAAVLAAVETSSGDTRARLAAQMALLISEALPLLPQLPLALGARVVAIGDSQIAFNTLESGAIGADLAANSNALGFIQHALALDPRFRFESWYDIADPTARNIGGSNQGVFGDHLVSGALGGILGRLPAVLATKPDLLIFEGGTNTISSGDGGDGVPAGAAFVIEKLDAALKLCRKAGVRVVLMTIYPRGDWPVGDARHATLASVNVWIKAQASRDGVAAILDTDALLVQGGVQNATMFRADRVHLNTTGALLVGREALLPILRDLILPGTFFDPNPLLTSLHTAAAANLQGTGGSKAGTIVPTGTVATDCIVTGTSNASAIVASKALIGPALEAQVIDITPADLVATAYGQVTLSLPAIQSNLPTIGQWVRAFLYVEVSGGLSVGCLRLQLAVRQASTVRARSYAQTISSSDFAKPIPARSGFWLITEPLQVPDAGAFDRLFTAIDIYWDKLAPAFQVKVSRPIVRLIADPRPS